MSTIKGPAPRPCQSCPYRQDVPSGVWSADEYEKLPHYDDEMAYQPQAVFQCHQAGPTDRAARLCAGWLGCHGPGNLLAIRLGVAVGNLDPDVLDYTTDEPLMSSGQDACEHGLTDIENPSTEARKLVAKIVASRVDVRYG